MSKKEIKITRPDVIYTSVVNNIVGISIISSKFPTQGMVQNRCPHCYQNILISLYCDKSNKGIVK